MGIIIGVVVAIIVVVTVVIAIGIKHSGKNQLLSKNKLSPLAFRLAFNCPDGFTGSSCTTGSL